MHKSNRGLVGPLFQISSALFRAYLMQNHPLGRGKSVLEPAAPPFLCGPVDLLTLGRERKAACAGSLVRALAIRARNGVDSTARR